MKAELWAQSRNCYVIGLLLGFSCLFILCLVRAFPTAEKRGKKPPADEKAGGVECLSGIRSSLRTPQPSDGLRRKAKIGRVCIGQFSALLPLSFQHVLKNAPAFS